MAFLLKILVYSLVTFPALAAVVSQSSASFQIDAEKLLNREVHAFVEFTEPKALREKFPVFSDMDALRLADEENVRLMVSKLAYVVDRPVSFFNDQQVMNPKWLAHTHPGQKYKKADENSFIATSSEGKHHLDVFFDSDDISNVERSRVIHAVTQSKKLDTLSGSSFSTTCLLLHHSTTRKAGEVSVTNYISLNSRKTLVITYAITALSKGKSQESTEKVRGDFMKEAPALVQRTNSFK